MDKHDPPGILPKGIIKKEMKQTLFGPKEKFCNGIYLHTHDQSEHDHKNIKNFSKNAKQGQTKEKQKQTKTKTKETRTQKETQRL